MLLDLIVSTAVFFAAIYFLRRFFDAQDIPPGRTRSILIGVLATVASFAASALLSWVDGEPSTDQQMLQQVQMLQQLNPKP